MVSGLQANKGEFRLASATTGTALSTTAAYIALPRKTQSVTVTPRNFSTAVVVRVSLCPWLIILKTLDSLATAPRDYSEEAQDANTGTSVDMGAMEAPGTGGYLYVGSYVQFRGVNVDVDATNSGDATVLTVRYPQAPGLWTDISDTDGTISSSKSLGQDASVTWTVPSGWQALSLRELGDTTLNFPYANDKFYWTRWEWSVAFTDTSVTLDHMLGINRSTAYWELAPGQAMQGEIENGPGGISAFESFTDAGTANLIVNAQSVGQFA